MYTKEELGSKNLKELYEIGSSLGISKYAHGARKSKAVIINEIIGSSMTHESTDNATNEVIDVEIVNESTSEKSEMKVDEVIISQSRVKYVESATVGTLVAFRLSNGRVKSAKIVKKSTSKRKFMVETKYGAQFIVSYDDVIWVKTGTRWPKGVYNLMKGFGDTDAKNI